MPNYIDIKLKTPVTFQPLPSQGGGANGRTVALPAGTVVRATPDSQRTDPQSTYQLLASVKGADDYYARKVPESSLDFGSPPPARRERKQYGKG